MKEKRFAIALLLTVLLLLASSPVWAQAAGTPGSLQGSLMTWVWFLAPFLAVWVILYWGLYRYLLHYYHPDHCKFLFWSLLILYWLGWLHLSLYLLFDIGYTYYWLRWVAVFLAVLWLIWFAITMVSGRTRTR